SSRSYSGSNSAAASPVEPATTTALVPASSCCPSSRRQASRSSSPATVKGVASAVMLPESCKPKIPGRSPAILLAAPKHGQVCWPWPARTAGPSFMLQHLLLRGRRLDRIRSSSQACAEREPPDHQRLYDAPAVSAAVGDPAHRRQRLQPGRGAPAHGRRRRLGDRAGDRLVGRGGQA